MIGTLPPNVEKSKVYTFDYEAVGDFVKIVTGRDDGYLSFANLQVYEANKSLDETEEEINIEFDLQDADMTKDEKVAYRKMKKIHETELSKSRCIEE